ncbi:MAG: helix-turn-helix domain-containing protein [Actinomycetota bacterium]
MQQHVETGIGRALRRARESRGKSLEQASRETRVRIDYLKAIEHEWFGALGSDVYVRGFLRSYSRYLGLNDEKVMTAYERAFGRSKPPPAPVEQSPTVAPTEAYVLTERKRPNWILAGGAAIIALAAAAAIGLIGRTDSVPEPAGQEPPPQVPVAERQVEVGITAFASTEAIELAVSIDDGPPQPVVLEEGGSQSFQGDDSIQVVATEGGLFGLIVNGHTIKVAGERRAPFDATFTPDQFRGKRSQPESPAA